MVAITAEEKARRQFNGWMQEPTRYPRVTSSMATFRVPIFVAPFDVEIGEVALINSTIVTGANTNTVHLNLIDGGAEGAGTTEVATRDLISGTDLIVGKTLLFDNIQGASAERFLAGGSFLELEAEEIGTGLGADIDEFMIIVVFRAANLSS
jgi:hypothetical protein